MDDRYERQRTSFGAAAHLYERVRPGYPAEAVDLLVKPGARRVVDLGAGTGKLTRVLLEAGLDVVAVEPSAGMRAEFARVLPGVPILAGRGEALPLDAASVDAVVAGQAWHWVDPERAVPEIARVLVPGGSLGLVWNLRSTAAPWIEELDRILGRTRAPGEGDPEAPVVGPPFGPLERHELPLHTELPREDVAELVASRSYALVLEPPERERLLAAVRRLLDVHPDTAGRERVPLPYRTLCYRALLDEGEGGVTRNPR
jgi:SAM-dependent methyltransferase